MEESKAWDSWSSTQNPLAAAGISPSRNLSAAQPVQNTIPQVFPPRFFVLNQTPNHLLQPGSLDGPFDFAPPWNYSMFHPLQPEFKIAPNIAFHSAPTPHIPLLSAQFGYNSAAYPPLINSVHNTNDMTNIFLPEGYGEAPINSSGRPLPHNLPYIQMRRPRCNASSLSLLGPHGIRNRNHKRSPMEEFCAFDSDGCWTLQDIFGCVVEFSIKSRQSSLLVQRLLTEASHEGRKRAFDEIISSEDTSLMIQDIYGNRVIQIFLDLGTISQKAKIALEIEDNIIRYSNHMYACYVVQKAFAKHMSEEQQDRVIDKLAANLLTCIKDQYGNYVIQKVIETVAPERLTFLHIINANILDLAANSVGCRVLRKCLLSLPQTLTKPMFEAVHQRCENLMKDRYGNYVIQCFLEHGGDDFRARVSAKIKGSFVKLAMHPFASHVCEKLLIYSGAQIRRLLINEILSHDEEIHPSQSMMGDDFAYYVLKRALLTADGPQRGALFRQVQSSLILFRNTGNKLDQIEQLVAGHFDM